jgi:hypothetical protein
MGLVAGDELAEPYYQALRDSGISDSRIRSGSVAAGRVYCCGSATETENSLAIFVPPEVSVQPGDIVELEMGQAPTRSAPGAINTAIRVREKRVGEGSPSWGRPSREGAGHACKWVPDNPMLWNRVLYCDWMKAEGWIEYRATTWKTWLKFLPE